MSNSLCKKCNPPATKKQLDYEKSRPYYIKWMKEMEERDLKKEKKERDLKKEKKERDLKKEKKETKLGVK